MPSIYGLSEICIYPSTASEPFGLTMLESLSTAKPMIVTNMGGMPEIVMNDINGYVVNVKDFETLASRIEHLLSEPRVSKRLGTTGRKMVCTHYTKGIMTKSHLDIYRNLLKGVKPDIKTNEEVYEKKDSSEKTRDNYSSYTA
jgi:glycosyltransferase involved in cell wall biosynthesis